MAKATFCTPTLRGTERHTIDALDWEKAKWLVAALIAATLGASLLSACGSSASGSTCAQLSRALLSKIEHLAVSSTQLEDKSCPSFLEAFLSVSEQERRESAAIDAGSLRKRGTRAFLIYYGARENVYAMPLRKEGSAWKVDSLAPKQLG